MDSLCHPWFTTTNLSYRVPILKLPPPPCAALLVIMTSIITIIITMVFRISKIIIIGIIHMYIKNRSHFLLGWTLLISPWNGTQIDIPLLEWNWHSHIISAFVRYITMLFVNGEHHDYPWDGVGVQMLWRTEMCSVSIWSVDHHVTDGQEIVILIARTGFF